MTSAIPAFGHALHDDRHEGRKHRHPVVAPPPVTPAGVPYSAILGSASPFGVFGGGAGVTNSGIFTVINGDLGTTGITTMITGFHDGNAVYTETPLNIGAVNGTVFTATAPDGSVPSVIASAAALDALKAYDALSPAALPGGIDVATLGGGAGELGNRTLGPGIYKSAAASFAIQGGDLTLDGRNDPNAIFVFQMASTLLVGGPGAAFPQSVILINGAQAKNVFWQVGSAATINAAGGGHMVGTIISSAATTFSTAGNVTVVTLEGRVLALNASVTMVNTHVNLPAL
ncbi:ice-binding family protein [Geothrix sp.]|nr:ice-binding family protein [Geothrix sp.]WIL20967.1 MAG: ice-binding family protein [Geothrix sp.]